MTLLECKPNERYRVVSIDTDDNLLLDRMVSFGVMCGSEFSLADKSIGDSNMSIMLKDCKVAFRKSEAKIIIVEKI